MSTGAADCLFCRMVAGGGPAGGGPGAADCLFCRMVAGEVPADVVHETGRTFAFRDINPQAPTHVLVVPKDHHATAGLLVGADPGLLAEVVAAAHAVAVQEGLAAEESPEPGHRPAAHRQ